VTAGVSKNRAVANTSKMKPRPVSVDRHKRKTRQRVARRTARMNFTPTTKRSGKAVMNSSDLSHSLLVCAIGFILYSQHVFY